jgi:glycosyltransferase involved in cell wall biosynthesis
MRESLSIIVPVRDRQSTIQARAESLLELISELSRHIQLILVDDFSSDATPEVLDDLRRKYPQIEVLRNRQTLGPAQAAEQALHRATGDFIFLHPSYDPVDYDELVQLWRLRRDDQLVVARASTRVRRVDTGFVNRLKDWSRRLVKPTPMPPTQWNGLHMLRRSTIEQLANSPSAADAVEFNHQSHRRLASPNLVREPISARRSETR